tara:strand:- start:47 stop:1174 length:1128 start_codon:yes stop_codon:yes gene_type:complete
MAYTVVDNPKAHFDVKTYQGTSSTKTISGIAFKPDMIWTKDRTEAYEWGCYDSSRGVLKWIQTNHAQSQTATNDITSTANDRGVASFTSDGFTIQNMTADPIGNKNGNQYAAWMWKANGASKTTNNAGANGASIASVYQANTTSGLSIVEYTGTGSAGTLKHGLSVKPKCIMIKRLDTTSSWQIYHGDTGLVTDPQTDSLSFDTTAGAADDATVWNDTIPTTSVFTVGTHAASNASSGKYVAYVFAETKGFSNFGTYFGVTNNALGPFVYTGFRPSMVIIKRQDGAESWQIADTARTQIVKDNSQGIQGNLIEEKLVLDAATAENSTSGDIDFYSNGFKPRDTDGIHNWTNYKYVYIAFAEMPLVGTNGTIALAY